MENPIFADPNRPMRRGQASKYLKDKRGLDYKPNTLAKLAVTGGGPEMQYIGRFPFYTPACLDKWADSRTSPPVASTSERRVQRENRQQQAAA